MLTAFGFHYLGMEISHIHFYYSLFAEKVQDENKFCKCQVNMQYNQETSVYMYTI